MKMSMIRNSRKYMYELGACPPFIPALSIPFLDIVCVETAITLRLNTRQDGEERVQQRRLA